MIPASAYSGAYAAARKKDNLQPFATPKVTPTAVTPGDPNVSKMMAATYAAPQGVSAAQTKTPYSIPAYGSNIAGFDPNNAQHKGLADAGQAYATAKAAGDTAGMSAAAALGQSLRAQNGVDEVYDAKKGVTTFQTPQPMASVNPAPASGDPYGQLTPTQINTEAAAQLARERAAMQTAATKRLTDLKSGFDYSNKLLQDNRTLENAQMDRTLNPFSGKTSYDKFMVNRGRGIDDSNRAAQFNAETAAVTEDLYNFDKLAPERQQQVLNELTRLERAYGIDVGNLTGNFNGQRTLAGLNSDRDYEQQQWENRFRYGEKTGQFGNGQKTLEMRRFEEDKTRYGEEFAYRKIRDEIADKNDQREFDERARQSGIDNAVQWYNAKTSRTSSGNAASSAEHNRLMDIWKATGKAPEGIAGVTPGTAWYEGASGGGGKPTPFDQTPEWGQEIAELNSDPQGSLDDYLKNSHEYIATYGFDGYQKLLQQARALLD